MNNSKLIDALRQLDARQRSKFRELLFSPFFNKNQKIRRLISHLLPLAPAFDSPKLEKETVFRVVFGKNDPFNELRLNNVISDTLQLLYHFFRQQALDERLILQQSLLVETLLGRRLGRHLPHASRRLEQLVEQEENRSQAHFHQEYRLAGLQDRYALLRESRGYSLYLQEMNDALDRYYFCSKFRIACDMANRNKAIQAGYECHFLETLLRQYAHSPDTLQELPALQVYYRALLMLQEEKEEHYLSLRKLLGQYHHLLPVEELYDLYDYAQNFCVKKINSGQAEYYSQILDLYKEMLERKVLLRHGFLTQWSYINIVTAGIRLHDYEWTSWFIHAYKGQLEPAVRENVFTYNLAALQFERGHYSLALQTLQNVEFSDAFYHMAAKIIQLKSYYELEETEAFFSLLEASHKYIRRNRQLSDYQKQSNAAFLKLAGRLFHFHQQRPFLSSEKARKQLHQLAKDIRESEALANKGWLVEKVGEGELI